MVTSRKSKLDPEKQERFLNDLRRDLATRRRGYRERALSMLPHICGSCGREFSGKKLSQLTVHHKDHNHDNNPPDGSNWELLCLYCHDHEHEKYKMKGYGSAESVDASKITPAMFNPFENLDQLLKSKIDSANPD